MYNFVLNRRMLYLFGQKYWWMVARNGKAWRIEIVLRDFLHFNFGSYAGYSRRRLGTYNAKEVCVIITHFIDLNINSKIIWIFI